MSTETRNQTVWILRQILLIYIAFIKLFVNLSVWHTKWRSNEAGKKKTFSHNRLTKFPTNKPSAHVRGFHSTSQVTTLCAEAQSIIITGSFTSTNGARNGGMRLKSASVRGYSKVTVRKWAQSARCRLIHHVSRETFTLAAVFERTARPFVFNSRMRLRF